MIFLANTAPLALIGLAVIVHDVKYASIYPLRTQTMNDIARQYFVRGEDFCLHKETPERGAIEIVEDGR